MIGFLTMALAVSAVGTLGSCKDYDDDNRVELQGEYAKLKADLKALTDQLSGCCGDFRDHVTESGNRFETIEEQLRGISGEDGALDKLLDDIADLNASINGVGGEGGINGQIQQILANYATVLADVSELRSALSSKLDAATFNTAQSEISNLIVGLQDAIDTNKNDFNSKITDLQGQLNLLRSTDLAALEARIAALEGKECPQPTPGLTEEDVNRMITENNVLLNQAIAAAVSAVQGNTNATIADVQASLTATDQKFAAKIDSLEQAINKEIAALKAQLGSLVTSVLVQGTYNPIFGSLTAPFNVQSNVLAAYYGYAEVAGSFPFANPGMFVNKDNSLNANDIKMIDAVRNGSFDFSDGQLLTDNNAGTIYLTINPTAVNFEGLNFRLENSLGEASPVKLGNLEPSYKKLTFGWTRGAAKNGFYEAQAIVADEDIQNAKLVVDMTKSDIKEIFKDVTSPKDGIDIMNIANKVYSVVNDVCDANAVKAYWGTDANANSTLSQYSIAATAVKPLSFAFMEDYHIDSFYGFDRVKNFINNTIDGINIDLSFGKITVPEIKKIEIKPLETVDPVTGEKKFEKSVTISTEVEIDGQTINVKLGDYINGKYEVKDEQTNEVVGTIDLGEMFKNQTITVKTDSVKKTITATGVVDMTDVIEDVYGQITDPIEDVNEMLGQLETFMGDVNKMIEEINGINQKIEDAKDNVASQINKYIDALNKRLCNVVNGIHDRLQPLAIAHNGKEFYTLSEIKNMPSKISGNTLHIVPTTYTAELVVPAFKKHVAVVNVFKGSASAQGGDAACLNALKAANNKGGMNTVVAGTTRDVEFVGEKGYTYEIAYSALDYSGKAVTKKYYVTVE